jgi:hypothetical protein
MGGGDEAHVMTQGERIHNVGTFDAFNDYRATIIDRPAVYAFCQNDRVMYVGSAERPRSRLAGYLRRQNRELPPKSRPVHTKLARRSEEGLIDVYIHYVRNTFDLGSGLPVDMLLGLESALVYLFDAPWNNRGRKRVLVEDLTSESREAIVMLREMLEIKPI